MPLPIVAILAALTTAKQALDHPLVCRLLKNVAARSANKIDDWIISVLYGTPAEMLPVTLSEAQQTYDATPAAIRGEMKAEASALPWHEITPEQLQEALGNG